MKYEILKNYLLLKMEKDCYLKDEDIKILIEAIEKASEEERKCLELLFQEEEK